MTWPACPYSIPLSCAHLSGKKGKKKQRRLRKTTAAARPRPLPLRSFNPPPPLPFPPFSVPAHEFKSTSRSVSIRDQSSNSPPPIASLFLHDLPSHHIPCKMFSKILISLALVSTALGQLTISTPVSLHSRHSRSTRLTRPLISGLAP